MYMLIRYPAGVIVEAVVLARGRDRMRVAAAGLPDAIELRRFGAQWFTTTREPVEFDFLLATAHSAEAVFSSKPACVAQAAAWA
jgi:hypothetical protein